MIVRKSLRRLVTVVGLIALWFAGLTLLVLPQTSHAPDGIRPGAGGRLTALKHQVDDFVNAIVHWAAVLAETVVIAGAVVAVLATAGHLVGRYLRRSGPSTLPGRLAEVADRQRAKRAPVTLEIVLGRDDRATPYEVAKLFDGLAGMLRPARWYARLLLGADTISFKLVNEPEQRMLRFLLAVRADAADTVGRRLRATYPDVRVQPVEEWGPPAPGGPVRAVVDRARRRPVPPCPFRVVRLAKTRRSLWALQTTKDYQHSLVESLVAAMANSDDWCALDLVLTPAPVLLERRIGRAIRRHEQALHADVEVTPNAPGVQSAVAQQHIQGALKGVGGSVFAFDYRVLVPEDRPELSAQLAAVVREAKSENDITPHTVRLRRRLYVDRVLRSIPPLLPALRKGYLSTAELATLWHLPTLRVRHAGLNRAGARQLVAPPAISRARESVVLRDERGPVGIRPRDQRLSWAIMGASGAGKSALMLRHVGNIARDRSRALILVDPKLDLARDALAVIPSDRVVHEVDLRHPYAGINPLTILRSRDVSVDAIADIMITAIRETAGDDAVGARADQFLRGAVTAVCAVEDVPTLHHVQRMLDPFDSGYRDWVVRELAHRPGASFARDFWGRQFRARLRMNPRFLVEIVESALNKLPRLLAVETLAFVVSHPVQLDLAGIIDRREVLIIRGSKATVGEEGAAIICQLVVLLVQRLLHQQQELDRRDRAQVALVLDEAHNMLTPSFASMLAEGRAGGVEVTAAFQYTAQIRDETVKAGVRSLLQNISVFRMRAEEDARAIAGLAMEAYTDAISGDEDAVDRVLFDPTDVVKLPNFRAINIWLSDGAPQRAFTADTLSPDEIASGAPARSIAETHRRRVRHRGYHPHDHGRAYPEPLVWSIDTPALAHDGKVHVDLTSWERRPHELDQVFVVLRSRSGIETRLLAAPADRSGRRFCAEASTHRESPGYVAPGRYEVTVIATDGSRWRPTVRIGSGRDARDIPATVDSEDPLRDQRSAA